MKREPVPLNTMAFCRNNYSRMMTEAASWLAQLASGLRFSQELEAWISRTTFGFSSSFNLLIIPLRNTFSQVFFQYLTEFVWIFSFCPGIREFLKKVLNLSPLTNRGFQGDAFRWCTWVLSKHFSNICSFLLNVPFLLLLTHISGKLILEHFCFSIFSYYINYKYFSLIIYIIFQAVWYTFFAVIINIIL